jgi:hypothetical protein
LEPILARPVKRRRSGLARFPRGRRYRVRVLLAYPSPRRHPAISTIFPDTPGIRIVAERQPRGGFKISFGRFGGCSSETAPLKPELAMNIANLDPKRLAPCRFPATIEGARLPNSRVP